MRVGRLTGLPIAVSMALCAVPVVASMPPAPLETILAPAHEPGEVLIKFRPGAPAASVAAYRAELGAQVLMRFRSGAELWKLAPGRTEGDAIGRLRDAAQVQYVEPNYRLSIDRAPNDPRYDELYGLNNTGQLGGTPGADIDAERAWDLSTGSPTVVVAVIDTGVDYLHPDLAANIWTNPGEIAGNGLDDDANGYIDDTRGWDFINHDKDPMDDHSHGTHCAGTIAGIGDNAIGVAGVAWHVKILPLKFLGFDGSGSNADAVAAIEYATAAHVDVMSNSWGGGGFSQAMLDAIQAASDAGILFVAAAGNDGSDNDFFPHYPSSYQAPNVVSVAATDRVDELAWFSNYGASSVDLGAPGVDTLSCLPGNAYGVKSGTSMATPHVSGVAALIRSVAPGIDLGHLKDRLLTSVDLIPSLAGRTVTGGRANAFLAIADPDATPPSAVVDLTVTGSASNALILAWTAPGDDGTEGTATSYDVRFSPQPLDDGTFDDAPSAASPPHPSAAGLSESMEIGGLGFESTYYVALKAKDEWGNVAPISNVAIGTTLPPPTFAYSPSAFDADLLTGGTALRTLTLRNVGVGTLDFTIDDPRAAGFGWLAVSPRQGRVASGASTDVAVTVDATGLDGGDYAGSIDVHTNDPVQPAVLVPIALHVTGAPDVALQGEEIVLTSSKSYTTDGATTVHVLPVAVPPTGDGSVELIANGDYGDLTEFATAVLEGHALGTVGPMGSDCLSDSEEFPVGAGEMAAAASDGQFHVQVVNSPEVNAFCGVNTHTVRISYRNSATELAFGPRYVGTSTTRSIVVANIGTAPLAVTSITADDPDFGLSASSLTVPAHQTETLTVTFTPTRPAPIAATLTLTSDDPDTPVLTLPLTGVGVLPPVIGVSPSSMHSTLNEGAEEAQTLTISNTGASPLSFTTTTESFAAEDGVSEPSGEFQHLASSPVPLTCVVADPAAGYVYAQADQGLAFYRYVAATDTWETLASAPVPSGNNGGAALLNGKIYTVYTGSYSMGIYDIAGGAWATLPSPLGLGTGNIASDGTQFLYLALGNNFVRYDPAAGIAEALPTPPFYFEAWGALVWSRGRIYGHTGNGTRSFGVFDPTTNAWTRLPDVPGGAVLGASVDPLSGDYFTTGAYGGTNLYRFDGRESSWTTETIPYFVVNDGGSAWLPAPVLGIVFVEGETGTGFARFVPGSRLVTVTPPSGTLPPGASLPVEVRFNASGSPGVYPMALRVASNDPVRPLVNVPLSLTIIGRPDIAISGAQGVVESVQTYTSSGASTTHDLAVAFAPSGSATLELVAEGDYGDASETATATAEGLAIGTVGPMGSDCVPASGAFVIGAADFASLAADGIVRVTVQNTVNVDSFCTLNQHTVRLRWRDAATDVDFGAVFVGGERGRSLTIENRGSLPLNVSAIGTGEPTVVASIGSAVVPPHSVRSVLVTFRPVAVGAVAGTLTFTSDDPDEPLISVPFAGSGVEAPVIGVTPTALAATLDERTTETQTLTVSNTGGSPLEYSISVRRNAGASAAAEANGARLASGTFQRLAPSPAPLTCVVADTAAGYLYAQANNGYSFFRYSAADDAWQSLGSAPIPAGYNGGAALLNGTIYTAYANDTRIGIYDVASGMWTQTYSPLAYTGDIASDGTRYLYLARYGTFIRFDPVTYTADSLASPPFSFEPWGGLVFRQGKIYGHSGAGGRRFGVYDVATNTWTELAMLPPAGGILGAAIDPWSGDYYAVGGYGGTSLHRYDAADAAWTTETIPYFPVNGSGMGWLDDPVPGVLFVQGDGGTGLARFVPDSGLLTTDPASGTIAPGASRNVDVHFNASGNPGTYSFTLRIASNDPIQPQVDVPASLTIIGKPDIDVRGVSHALESVQDFFTNGATTTHALPIETVPSGPASLRLIAEGDYGDYSETAVVTAEGTIVGTVGEVGSDCYPADGNFTIAEGDFARMAADGVVDVQVQNSLGVDPFCSPNRHTVRLSWFDSADPVRFGPVFIGGVRTRSLSIENRGSLTLHVTSIVSSEPTVAPAQTTIDVPPHGAAIVDLVFTPVVPVAVSGGLTISSDDPDEGTFVVPFTGEGLVAPDIAVTPVSFSESLSTGATVTRTMSIDNSGGSVLNWRATAQVTAGSAAAHTAGRVLLVQDYYAAPSYPNETVLTANGIPYDTIQAYQLAGTPLDGYPLVIIAGEQYVTFYQTLSIQMSRLEAYVRAGGHLEFHGDSFYQYSNLLQLPGGVAIGRFTSETNLVTMPGHPLVEGVPSPVTHFYASRVYFDDLPPGARIVMTDASGHPTLIDYTLGFGSVVASGQTIEASYGTPNTVGRVLENAIPYNWNRQTRWLRISPESGAVPAGGRADVDVTLDASGMLGGDYDAAIDVRSNDPDESSVPVTAHLHVIGVPDIVVQPSAIDFGPNFLGYPASRVVTITNVGTDVLHVGPLATDHPAFTGVAGSYDIAIGGQIHVSVGFAPTAAGLFNGTLRIPTNDPDEVLVEVPLTGESIVPPDIGVDPVSLSESLYASGTVTRIVTVSNTGGSDLTWELRSLRRPSSISTPPTVLGGAPPAASNVPPASFRPQSAPPHVAGQTARILLVEDYGPWGLTSNELVLTSLQLPFDIVSTFGLATVDLATYGLIIVASDQPTSSYDRIAAEMGRLTAWITAGGVLEFHAAGWGWNSGDASRVTLPDGVQIQQSTADTNLVVTPGHPIMQGVPNPFFGSAASHAIFSSVPAGAVVLATDPFNHPTLIEYAYGSGAVIAAGQTLEFAYFYNQGGKAILPNMIAYANERSPRWIQASPVSGVIPAGGSAALTVTLDATDLQPGDYAASMVLDSNDPDEASVAIPVALHVIGAPEIDVTPTGFDFGTVFQGFPQSRSIHVANLGTEPLHVASIATGDPSLTVDLAAFVVPPGGSVDVLLTWNPSTVGPLSTNLTIASDDADEPTFVIGAIGLGLVAPDIRTTPASFSESLFTGQTVTRSLNIDNVGGSDLSFHVHALVHTAGARALLVEDFVPWDTLANETVLAENGIDYDVIPSSQLQATVLSDYPLVILASEQPWWFYANLTAASDQIRGYVETGGCLEYHASSYFGDAGVFELPGGLTTSFEASYDNFVVLPAHPFVAGVPSFFSGGYASHSIFGNVPDSAQIVTVNDYGNPTLVEYRLGSGTVVASGQTLEYGFASGGPIPTILSNMITFDWSRSIAWLSLTPASGTVPAGGRAVVTVAFDATGLYGGDYDAGIEIDSNDPDGSPVVTPVQMHVTGVADVTVDPDHLAYGTVFTGTSASLALTIRNDGTDVLHVGPVTIDDARYGLSATSFDIPIAGSASLTVTFSPSVAGTFDATLRLPTNDPDATLVVIPVTAAAAVPPVAGVTPSELHETLLPGQLAHRIVTISNTGGEDLLWSVSLLRSSSEPAAHAPVAPQPPFADQGPPPLVRPEGYAPRVSQAIRSTGSRVLIVQDYAPWYTSANEQILSAAGVPFDVTGTGSLASLDLDTYVLVIVASDQMTASYQNIAAAMSHLDAWIRAGGVLEFHAAAWSWNGGDASVVTLPRGMGIQRMDSSTIRVVDPTHPIVEGVPDPTVVSLSSLSTFVSVPAGARIITTDAAGLPTLVEYPYGAGLVVASGHTLEYYWAPGSVVGRILTNMTLYGLAVSPDWLSVAPLSGTLPPGATAAVDVTFDATHAAPGQDHVARFTLTSNDPIHPAIDVPVTLHIPGVPDIAVLPASLDFGTVYAAIANQRLLNVANHGSDVLSVSSITSTNPALSAMPDSFTLAPGESRDVAVVLTPPGIGAIAATLTIVSDDADSGHLDVAVTATSVAAPHAAIPSSVVEVTLLSGSEATQTLDLRNTGGSDLAWEIHAAAGGSLRAGPGGAPPSSITPPPGFVRVRTAPALSGTAGILLVQDNPPWGTAVNEQILTSRGLAFDVVDTTELALVDLSRYGLMIIASDQTTAAYQRIAALMPAISAWVAEGGILEFHAAGWGWYAGDISLVPLPGGAGILPRFSNITHVVAPDHPILQGLYEPIVSSIPSHTYFINLPAGAVTVAADDVYHPNVVTYDYGLGQVFASGHALEISYVYGEPGGAILLNMSQLAADLATSWITIPTRSGTVPAGSLFAIPFVFDAARVPPGDYEKSFVLASNDPDQREIPIGVRLHVVRLKADAGPDQVVECSGTAAGAVILDGSGSSHADGPGAITRYAWSEGDAPIGEGASVAASLGLGHHDVTLRIEDASGASNDDAMSVDVADSLPPAGAIVSPSPGACYGPSALPVVVQDSYADACQPTLTRTYDPPGGSSFSTHGDHAVQLTVSDASGHAAPSASVAFTIDTVAPVVTILPHAVPLTLSEIVPFAGLYASGDADGASGGVVHETLSVDGCLVYDGATYGDGDGLLIDEAGSPASVLCDIGRACGRRHWSNPVVTVTATDCAGNSSTGTLTINGASNANACAAPLTLTLGKQPGASHIGWNTLAGAASYQIVAGDLKILHTSGGSFSSSTNRCLAPSAPTSPVTDAAVPAPGNGYWYLVRDVTEGLKGSWDEVGATQAIPRDAGITASGRGCP